MDVTPDRALIYSIIQGGVSAFQHAKSLGVREEFVVDPEDRKIFNVCEEVFLPKGKMPSVSNIRQHYRIDLQDPTADFDIDLCAQDIMRRALMTRLHDDLGPIVDSIPKDPYKARDAIGELYKSTNWSLGSVDSTNSPSVLDEIMQDYLDAEARDGGLLGFSSPWPSRDKVSLGLQPGEVTVLLAKRKAGKSWLLLKWAEHIWNSVDEKGEPELQPDDCILVVSMEMPRKQVFKRIFAIHNKLDYEKFRGGKLDPDDKERFVEWIKEMKETGGGRPEIIVVTSDRVRTVDDVVGMVAQYRPKAVFIDSFYILGRDNTRMQMWERMISNISDIKLDIAVGFDIPVVTTTQLSGQVKKGDMNAEADAVAYAKAIGDYADAIDGIFGNVEFRENRRRILRGMEAREFKTIDIEINFDPGTQEYGEIKVMGKVEEGSGKSLDGSSEDDSDPAGSDDVFYGEDDILID
jgi:replicative DNA helicase